LGCQKISGLAPLIPHADEDDTFCIRPLAERVSVGFTFPTVHGFDLVCLAKERDSAAGSDGRTFVRMAFVLMALPGTHFPDALLPSTDVSRSFTTSPGPVYLSSYGPGPWLTEPGILAKAASDIPSNCNPLETPGKAIPYVDKYKWISTRWARDRKTF